MNCFMCKGALEEKKTTFMVDLGDHIIIIKDVPSYVCSQCGDTSYSDEVARVLEEIVESLRHAPTEMSVVNYAHRPAA
ncbi:type II toxin-antitoxin system MqsA family antitoxin [uncultured Selenomonas sp.]|uniref:type II toxin-antitoxin system MqsA family antitoxin n=1 Tax=uncultured Selenomonas sp. TaxID=159275 RepID=UPI0028DB7728|nr:type II toxin-antitoxin system MqsA family antitoxin [uncultured Selenomonas sp.]